VPYEMKPLESFTDKPDVIALCNMFGRGEIDQEAAQAAAWHLANDLSWQELAAKIGAKHLNGTVEPFFSRAALARGVRVANEAVRRSEGQQPVSPGEQQVTTP